MKALLTVVIIGSLVTFLAIAFVVFAFFIVTLLSPFIGLLV